MAVKRQFVGPWSMTNISYGHYWTDVELLEVLLKVSLSSTNETSNGVITFQSCPRRNWQSKMDLPGTASVQILEQIFHFKNILKF